MHSAQASSQSEFAQLSKRVQSRNQKYLNDLKESGDVADARSKVLSTIIDCIADGLLVFDEKLTILLANAAGVAMTHYELEEMTRSEVHKRYNFYRTDRKTPLPVEEEPIVVAMREKRPHEMEGIVVDRDTLPLGRWLRVHAAPILDDAGNAVGGVSVFSDITEKMTLQRQRDCLTTLIGHDIKNHLAAEQIFYDMLLGLSADKLDPESLKILKDLRAAGQKYLSMADSLMELSRTQFFAGAAIGHEANLRSLVQDAVNMSEPTARERQVKIAVEIAAECPNICGLPAVTCNALHNVIQNAVGVSAADSTVTVNVSFDPKYAIVKVVDSGPGMSADSVARLFSPERVAAHITKTSHSSGFALYLSSMLIEGEGGTITCSSELGKGTEITITLPVPNST